MSLESNFNITFKRYAKTATGTAPEIIYTWAARDATAIDGYLSDESLTKITENGKVRIEQVTRLRIRPLTIDTTDRVFSIEEDTVYSIEDTENIDRLGREMVVYLRKLEPGTKAKMGIS